jgi:hypothetical protein
MKKLIVCAAMLALVAIPMGIQAETPESVESVESVESAVELEQKIETPEQEGSLEDFDFTQPETMASLVSCGSKNGTYCSTPFTKIRCMWAPYEPGICVCQSNNTWLCG